MVLKIPTYFLIPLSVGIGIFLMLITNTTHPPAGGNPIVIIEKGDVATLSFLLDPIIYSCSLIIIFGIILNRLILKSNYPKDQSKQGLGLGLFIGKTLLEKNFAVVNCRNSRTRSGAEINIKWKNKELFNI